MSTTIRTTITTLLAALLAAALFLSPVGISQAQDEGTDDGADGGSEESGEEGDRRDEILEAFAAELGVTGEEVIDAARTVAVDLVEEALAEGRITQEQADRAIAAIEEAPYGGLWGLLHRRHHHHHRGWGDRR